MQRLLILICFAMTLNGATWTAGASSVIAGSSPSTASCALSVMAGDLIIVMATPGNTVTSIPAISDNVNGTYTQIATVVNNRPTSLTMYAKVASTTATVTITMTAWPAVEETLHAVAFTPPPGTIASATAQTTGTSTSTNSIALTTTSADELIIGVGDASSAISAGSGYTQIQSTMTTVRLLSEYKLTDAPGVNNVTWTMGTQRGGVAAAFVAATGITTTRRRILN